LVVVGLVLGGVEGTAVLDYMVEVEVVLLLVGLPAILEVPEGKE
jgi:hypothetical protein